jgi:hypothetical protein
MHELAHEFTSRKISPWGGIKYFQRTYVTSGMQSFLSTMPLPKPGSNRGYSPMDLIEGFMVSVILGSRRLQHTGLLNHDEVIKNIFGWRKGMATASTFSRFFRKFDPTLNKEIFPAIMKYFYSTLATKYLTLDIDSTVVTRHGHQEKAIKGYNPLHPGSRSHHPLLAFCDELKMVVNAWMRPGNTDSKTNAIEFLQEVFEIVSREKIGLLRGDVGFFSGKIMSFLEEKPHSVNYIFRARLTGKLLDQIAQLQLKDWYANNDVVRGAAYAEVRYKGQLWKESRRIVIVRIPRDEEDKSKKAKKLFAEFQQFDDYEFHAFVTNSSWSGVDIHRRYNQRGESENRIKELKYDFAMDGFALQSFSATEAAFRFIMIAFNIMQLFKQAIMLSKKNYRLATIKFQCIAIGSYLVRSGRKTKMKLAAEGRRRHFLEHIFQNLEYIKPPYSISNA